jgi:hypothetical protein
MNSRLLNLLFILTPFGSYRITSLPDDSRAYCFFNFTSLPDR